MDYCQGGKNNLHILPEVEYYGLLIGTMETEEQLTQIREQMRFQLLLTNVSKFGTTNQVPPSVKK